MTLDCCFSLPVQALRKALTGVCVLAAAAAAFGQPAHQDVLDAREALRRKDSASLERAVDKTARHPLAMWVQYWELSSRLERTRVDEVEAFYARWPGTYVEDRLRNDWLLELGKRRDWDNFSRDYPRFRMDDDREVTCYALLTRHLRGEDVAAPGRDAWFAQRDLDDGCDLLASNLYAKGHLTEADAWQKARLSIEANRGVAARAAAALVDAESAKAVALLGKSPQRYLASAPARPDARQSELVTLALLRLASTDTEAAVVQLQRRWHKALPKHLSALAWAAVGRQAALELRPEATEHYQRAAALRQQASAAGRALTPWSDEMLAWQARAALRSDSAQRWTAVASAIDAMPPGDQQDPAWVYWRARALLATAAPGPEGQADRSRGRRLLESIAGQMHFYGKLATEELGEPVILPAAPAPLAAAERDGARRTPGLERALLLIDIGLRSEGVREWNFTLRGMDDRQLLAAAQWACERQVWDRCINTSDRTRGEVDLAQRFPTPFRDEVLAQSRETGVDPAYVYGLIRQESRFIMDARSGAGASGLMQLMPATARWTAKKLGVRYTSSMIADRDMNLRLGTGYLKLVLDDFEGSQALATAAYNAGPGRPRRWREGPLLEPAAWAENIPFNETRDYVKKVLSNSVYYGALLNGQVPTLKSLLGPQIGPRDAMAAAPDGKLP